MAVDVELLNYNKSVAGHFVPAFSELVHLPPHVIADAVPYLAGEKHQFDFTSFSLRIFVGFKMAMFYNTRGD